MDKTLEQIQKFIEQACDKQRNASDMPELPVLSAYEIENRGTLNSRLDTYNTDYFFFLKEQEDECLARAAHASFYADDRSEIDKMIQDDLFSEVSSKVLAKWLENAAKGDKIIIRKSMPDSVTGKVARLVGDETVIEDTREYVLVLVATDEFFEFSSAFPV